MTSITGYSPYAIAKAAGLPLSLAQTVCLKASGGDPLLTKPEIKMFSQLTGISAGLGAVKGLFTSTLPRSDGYRDVIYNCGRQGGKTNVLIACEAVSAAMAPIQEKLSPGQSAYVLVIAPKLELTRSAFKAICGLLDQLRVPFIKREAVMEAELVDQRIIVECIVADSDSGRSRTCVAVIIDEAAKLPSDPDGSVYDGEIMAAIRPSLVVLNGKLVRASTPWVRSGEYFKDFERAHGKRDPDTLALSCSTFILNPTVDEKSAEKREHDKRRFQREYLALWTESEANYLRASDVRACVDRGVYQRMFQAEVQYAAVIDYASAGGGDENVLGIGHRELRSRGPSLPPQEVFVLDFIKGWRSAVKGTPLDLDAVIREQAATLRRFKINKVHIDIASRDLLSAVFGQFGIRTETLSVAVGAQAARFATLGNRIETHAIRLLDDPETVKQLCNLQQKLHQSGRYNYQVPPRLGHDDRVDVIAGLLDETVITKMLPAGDLVNIAEVFYRHDTGVTCKSTWWVEHRLPNGEVQRTPAKPPTGTIEAVRAAVKRFHLGEHAPGDELELNGIDIHDPQWSDPEDAPQFIVPQGDDPMNAPGVRFSRSMSSLRSIDGSMPRAPLGTEIADPPREILYRPSGNTYEDVPGLRRSLGGGGGCDDPHARWRNTTRMPAHVEIPGQPGAKSSPATVHANGVAHWRAVAARKPFNQ